jgi:MFS transporter, PAT family, beta-lactamase induction signal transducer AmpG
MTTETKKFANPALWVPSSYMAMGFVLCSLTMSNTFVFENLGLPKSTNTSLAAFLLLPYTFKFLWAPILELYRTKKYFVVAMQLLAAALMALIGLALQFPAWLTLAFSAMMLCSFVGATIDIGTDGVYVTTLDDKQKARWAGLQSMAWTGGALIAQGALVWFAGKLHDDYKMYDWAMAWMWTFLGASVILAVLAAWHGAFMPPGAKAKDAPKNMSEAMAGFRHAFKTFFKKQLIWRMLALAFFYRFGWYLIEKVNNLFLISKRASGGLGLSNKDAGPIGGIYGALAFAVASTIGGILLAKIVLNRKKLAGFCTLLLVPNLAFLWLSVVRPEGYWTITAVYSIGQFGYGLGAVAHMYYMMRQIAPGPYQTAHYAFATGAMGLCNFVCTKFSGQLAESLGYQTFYTVALLCVIPGIIAAATAPFVHSMKDEPASEAPASA